MQLKGTLFWMKSVICPWRCRPRFCAPCRTGYRAGRRPPRAQGRYCSVIATTDRTCWMRWRPRSSPKPVLPPQCFPIPVAVAAQHVEDIAPGAPLAHTLSATTREASPVSALRRCRPWRRITGRATSASCRTPWSARPSSQLHRSSGYLICRVSVFQTERGRCDRDPQRQGRCAGPGCGAG